MPSFREYEELMDAAETARTVGDHAKGAELAEKAVALTQHTSTSREHAAALAILCVHLVRLSDTENGRESGERALAIFTDLEDWLEASRVRSMLALAYENLNLPNQALAHATEALSLARRCGDRAAECWAMMRTSNGYEHSGDSARAVAIGNEAIVLAHEIGEPEGLFAAHYNLAWAETTYGRDRVKRGLDGSSQFHHALDNATEAVALAEESGNRHRVVMARHVRARLLSDLGDHSGAVTEMRFLIDQARAIAVPGLAQLIEVELASALAKSGATMDALALLNEVSEKLHHEDDADLQLEVLDASYRLSKTLGRFEDALRFHEEFHNYKLAQVERIVGAQARVLVNKLELDQARHDVEIERTRSEALHRAANQDVLTGLANRRAVDEQVPNMLRNAEANVQSLTAAIIDIDHFKVINDTFGHSIGDEVLTILAEILRSNVRHEDIAARIGGEEFLVVLVRTPLDGAVEVSERIRQAVAMYDWHRVSLGLAVTVSIGVDQARPADDMLAWLKRADDALYNAKRNGRDRVSVAA